MSGHRVGVFVATMTGTAEICAEEIASALDMEGFETTRQLMDGLSGEALKSFDYVVIVSSTYGHGDIPDNGQAFYHSLLTGPALNGVRFAVFGLGDRTYAATFCEAGRKWDALFASKGAVRYASLLQHDASSGTLAEDEAAGWASKWAVGLKEAA